MKTYKCLTLTDHRGHSQENSIYALMAKLSKHPQCEYVDVASRGNSANDSFFFELSSTQVYVKRANHDFAFDETGESFIEDTKLVNISDYDLIIMRLPRPVSDDFLDFLARKATHQVLINHPLGIKKTSSKAYLQHFSALCPPIKLCYSIEEILNFAASFPIVLKPLKEYGGKGILKIDGEYLYEGNEKYATLPYLEKMSDYIENEGFLAMQFLKNVSQGDKRILVVDGTILASSLRLPAEGSWMCNVAQGGTSVPTQVSPEEEMMINTISPQLKKDGILIFGADTLVGDDGLRVLSEVNTLSIGGFPQSEQQTGKPVLQQTINKIIAYVDEQKRRNHSHHFAV